MKEYIHSHKLTEELMLTLSAPCPVLSTNEDIFFNSNTVVDEVVQVALRLKMFDSNEEWVVAQKVSDFLVSINDASDRNRTGKNYWDGRHNPEEAKAEYPEEFMVACVRGLEILKWIWYDDVGVRLKTKIANMVESWDEGQLCEIFGGLDRDDIYDQWDEARLAINRAHEKL